MQRICASLADTSFGRGWGTAAGMRGLGGGLLGLARPLHKQRSSPDAGWWRAWELQGQHVCTNRPSLHACAASQSRRGARTGCTQTAGRRKPAQTARAWAWAGTCAASGAPASRACTAPSRIGMPGRDCAPGMPCIRIRAPLRPSRHPVHGGCCIVACRPTHCSAALSLSLMPSWYCHRHGDTALWEACRLLPEGMVLEHNHGERQHGYHDLLLRRVAALSAPRPAPGHPLLARRHLHMAS